MYCIKTRWATALATCCVVGLLSLTAAVCAEDSSDAKTGTGPKTYPPNSKSNPLAPTFADVLYGEHERNKLDFWQAESEALTPVIMILHGGGWIAGSKANVPRSPRFLPTGRADRELARDRSRVLAARNAACRIGQQLCGVLPTASCQTPYQSASVHKKR